MRGHLAGALWRLTIFTVVCAVGAFGLVAIFAEFRPDSGRHFRAEFVSVTGLEGGNFVRVAGVEVGKVKSITVTPQATAVVEFSADSAVVMTEGTRAVIRYDNLIGGRYLELQEGAGGTGVLQPGATIPLAQTSPALDLDAVIGGFRPLFNALDPDQVNALTGQLIRALEGQADSFGSFFAQTAVLTNTLADRDQLIGDVIKNLSGVLGSLGDESEQLDKGITAVSSLVATLAERRDDLSATVAHVNASAGTLADLLQQTRPAIKDVVTQTDRVGGLAVADHAYLDNLLNTLPDTYQVLNRLGLYGDFFTFYLCDALLKVNGKGGQPVYIKLAGQNTGRCAPK